MATKKKLSRSRGTKKPAATAEDTGISPASLEAARRKVRESCDRISYAVATAQQAEDFDAIDSLVPVLASLWSVRMELGDPLLAVQP